jgi:hypothetical protein
MMHGSDENRLKFIREDLGGGGGEIDEIIHYRFLTAREGRLLRFI